MPDVTHVWGGDDWENHALRLVSLSFPPGEIQLVPARHRGDLGIDAFSLDGKVFQCYAPEEPLSVADRYAKQRKKINNELTKLRANEKALKDLLGGKLIERWILLIPLFDSRELIRYAAGKADEIKK